MTNLVSIITPVHNSELFLEKCLQSVLSQTYSNWEHILIDDCSTDNSFSIIMKYVQNDSRVNYVKLNKNSGAGIARNKAIELAKGRFIAFLDSDDLWHPTKLKKQLAFMENNNCFFSFTSYSIIDEDGNEKPKVMSAIKEVTYNSALYKNPIGCLTVIYDVDFYGKQYMPSIRKRQDFALWLKLLKKANACGLNEVLSFYRDRKNSISSSKIKLIKYEWKIYREEGFNIMKSSFYLLSAIILKMKSYF